MRTPEIEPWRRQWIEESTRDALHKPSPVVPPVMQFVIALVLGYAVMSAIASAVLKPFGIHL